MLVAATRQPLWALQRVDEVRGFWWNCPGGTTERCRTTDVAEIVVQGKALLIGPDV